MNMRLYKCPDTSCGFERMVDEDKETEFISYKNCPNRHYHKDLGWHSFNVKLELWEELI